MMMLVCFWFAESTDVTIFAMESSTAASNALLAVIAKESLALAVYDSVSASAPLHGKRTVSATQMTSVLANMYLDNLLLLFTTLLLFFQCVENAHYLL